MVLSVTSSGVSASLFSPELAVSPIQQGTSLFNLAGSSLLFDQGLISIVGSDLGSPIAYDFDLAASPIEVLFLEDTFAVAFVDDSGGGSPMVSFNAPIALTIRLYAVPIATEFVLGMEGQIQGSGTVVPEPSTGLLVLLGLAVLGRRRLGVVGE
jgi:hypothetical protein